ncbi:MAG: response regulator [Pseudomonadota bacterium]
MSTCLVVDDSDVIREIICRMVGDIGLDPIQARSAGEGVDLCQEQMIAVVLLDWDLPSMGALDFLRGVGELPADQRPKIVLCATENDQKQFTLAQAAGAQFHILKPFDKERLAETFVEAGVMASNPFTDERAAS